MKRTLVFLGIAALGLFDAGAFTSIAQATPLDLIPVGDPLEDEVRVLEILGAPLRLPRLGMRPLQVVDLPALDAPLGGAAEISRARLLRALARDRGGADTVRGATLRLLQLSYPDEQRLEFSGGFEGGGTVAPDLEPELEFNTGLRLRFGLQSGRWLAYSNLIAGYVESGSQFAEQIYSGTDAVLHTQESYLSYTGARERWSIIMGINRWHWGPGEEASLLLSKTAPPLTGMAWRVRIEPLRADGTVLNATLAQTAGEQLAAHRLEWQPLDNLRVGLAEAARYESSSWEPLYFVGVIPYALVQNLLVRNEPDSAGPLRNNVLAAFDAAWRAAPGTRFYFEVLVDDLKTDEAPTISKYAYQLGWEGAGTMRGRRVTWGTEYTRLTRFVYTSYFDRDFAVNGVPLGFPTGPDAGHLRVRAAFDPTPGWQVSLVASRTDSGESGIDDPYVPGTPPVDSETFAGVVETRRELELTLRYWPTSSFDLSITGAYAWVDNADHVAGSDREEPRATARLRWIR